MVMTVILSIFFKEKENYSPFFSFNLKFHQNNKSTENMNITMSNICKIFDRLRMVFMILTVKVNLREVLTL